MQALSTRGDDLYLSKFVFFNIHNCDQDREAVFVARLRRATKTAS